MMKYLVLVLMLIANAAYANTPFMITMDKINWEVNQEFTNVPDNCLLVALVKQSRLLKQDIKSKIFIIKPAFATMKHAVLCVDDQCIDNGDISKNIFNKNELSHFGRVSYW